MKTARSEEEINVCQYTEAKQFELKLKELEDNIRSNLTGIQLDRFNDAQLNWQKSAEKDCEFEANFYEGAPIYLAIQSQCMQTHYQMRLQTISNYQCPEHNYTSGCESSDYVSRNTKAIIRESTGSGILIIDHSTTALTAIPPQPNPASVPTAPKPKKISNTKRFR